MTEFDSDDAVTLVQVEEALWVVWRPTGFARYDFEFEKFFACRHPWRPSGMVVAIARLGATGDYPERYARLRKRDISLIHTPEQYARASEITGWYSLLEDLTPRTVCFPDRPKVDQVTAQFRWPVFLKGSRQTSRHQRRLSVINNAEEFAAAMAEWETDPILRWQPVACREFVPLRLVGEQSPTTLPRAFEFRSFWWHGRCVGIGPYWTDAEYSLGPDEQSLALEVGAEAARRVGVPFLVVDLAQTVDGRWIVIECNDGQDAGYAGINPMLLWRRVIDIELLAAR